MKKRILYIAWGILYALCAGLGHINESTGVQSIAMTLFSLLFFVPPAILLIDALRSKDKKTLLTLRLISIVCLALTLLALLSILTFIRSSQTVGIVLHEILIFVSVPMICSRFWALCLFLWAVLLFASIPQKSKS